MANIQGNILNITKDGRRVLLNEQTPNNWFDLADNIKSNWLKRGACEYSLDRENPKLIIYIKNVQNGSNEQKQAYSKPYLPGSQYVKPDNSVGPNEFEVPVEVVRVGEPELKLATEYKGSSEKDLYWAKKEERDLSIQESIKDQFCTREAIHIITSINSLAPKEERIEWTTLNLRRYKDMVKNSFDF
jgi:hypothetical protein